MSEFNYIELFSGIGGFRSAFDPLGGNCVFASEIDSFATQSYRALYNGAPELHGDITQIDAHDIPDHDVLVGGFPCQAFSVAGQRKGFEEARGTLFFEIARIASAKQPRLMLLENVKGLLSHDGGKTFDVMCAVLNDIGYAIDFRVLNSKHYGVPQNRERIFIVCDRDAVHEDWTIEGNGVEAKAKRRAQDMWIKTFNFDWPTNDTVTTRLRDILEDNVDERYYLSEEKTAALVAQLEANDARKSEVEDVICVNPRKVDGSQTYQQDRVYEIDGVMTTLNTDSAGRFNILDSPIIAGSLEHYGNDQMNRVYSVDGVAPTITVVSGGGREQKIAVIGRLNHYGNDQMNRVHSIDGLSPTVTCRNSGNEPKIAVECVGNVNPSGSGMNGGVYDSNGLSPTLTTNKGEGLKITEEIRPVLTPDRPEKRQNGRRFKDDDDESFTLTAQDKHGIAIGHYPRYRIRKLTPLECWRLQGFTDEQHDTVKSAGISDSQRYKQAGNAVTVSVISAIAERLCQRLPVTDDEFERLMA